LVPLGGADDPFAEIESVATKLLCASVLAQGIDEEGTRTELPKFVKCAGFLNNGTVVQGGIDNNDLALVATIDEGVVVAFRGTITRGERLYSDWLQDLQVILVKPKDFPGRVHAGFYTAVGGLWADKFLWETSKRTWMRRNVRILSRLRVKKPKVWLKDEVERQVGLALAAETGGDDDASKKKTTVWVTGHSKGGGLAPIAAYLLHSAGYTVRTAAFASPNPGNFDFAEAYDAEVPQISYENYVDLVALTPHAFFHYVFDKQDKDEKEASLLKSIGEFLNLSDVEKSADADVKKEMPKKYAARKQGKEPEEEEPKEFSYVPVGKRVVIGPEGVRTTPAESPDDERIKAILDAVGPLYDAEDGLIDGAGAVVGKLFEYHCKQCPCAEDCGDNGICQGRYVLGIPGALESVCGGAAAAAEETIIEQAKADDADDDDDSGEKTKKDDSEL